MAIDPVVLDRLPQRPPFLWVDRIISEDRESLTAAKDIDPALPLFAGHFPGRPLLPGVIITEALVQAGALLLAARGARGTPILSRIRSARFRREVRPGDCMILKVRLVSVDAVFFTLSGRATVAAETVCNLKFVCTVRQAGGKVLPVSEHGI